MKSWLATGILWAGGAWGQAPAEILSAHVSLRDLDLASEAGHAEAHRRIRATALRLCSKLGNPSRADDREAQADCVRNATDAAVARLQRR
jgi:UrcA family protein